MMALWMLSNATAQSINSQTVVFFKRISEQQFFMYSGLFTLIIGIIIFNFTYSDSSNAWCTLIGSLIFDADCHIMNLICN